MNIGVVVDNYFYNDIRVRKECRILADSGHSIFVLCYSNSKYNNTQLHKTTITGIKIPYTFANFLFVIVNRLPIFNYLWGWQIKNFINKYNLDVIHAHDLYMSKPASIGIKLSNRNIPLILDLHENYPAAIQSYGWANKGIKSLVIAPKKWAIKEKSYLHYASKIIVLSNHYKQFLLNKYTTLSFDNIIVYPNVIDYTRFSSFPVETLNKDKKLTLFYFGVLAQRRGIFEAIHATKEIIKRGFDVKLLMIGPVDKADKFEFFSQISNIETSNNFEYIPWINLDKLVSYLKIVDICLAPFHKNPQHESGIANKIFQYMYGGKPIVASNCGPQQELIETNEIGLIYKTQDEFVDQIIKLIKSPVLRIKMGENAKKVLFTQFHPDKIDKALINLYKNNINT